jgi:hypothetical protein
VESEEEEMARLLEQIEGLSEESAQELLAGINPLENGCGASAGSGSK